MQKSPNVRERGREREERAHKAMRSNTKFSIHLPSVGSLHLPTTRQRSAPVGALAIDVQTLKASKNCNAANTAMPAETTMPMFLNSCETEMHIIALCKSSYFS